jgi:hypothetical protein
METLNLLIAIRIDNNRPVHRPRTKDAELRILSHICYGSESITIERFRWDGMEWTESSK